MDTPNVIDTPDDLERIYVNYGFPSAQRLYPLLKGKYTMAEVINFIKAQTPYQLHKKQGTQIEGHMTSFSINQIWQADLLDLYSLHRKNKGYKYILIVIDVFTRKAYAEALKNKNANTVLDAFKTIV